MGEARESEGKGSNINKFVKGRESQFLSFEFQNLLCYSLRERETRDCFFLLFQLIIQKHYFHLWVPSQCCKLRSKMWIKCNKLNFAWNT